MRSNLFSRKLIEYRDAQWLIDQRMRFVSRNRSATSRNRPHAGRTGTRGGLGGRPQPRWQEGVALAKQVLNVSADDSENNSFLNVGSQIQGIRNSLNSLLTFNTFFGRRSSPGVT